MQTKMSLQLYQVDSRTYLLDFRSIDGEIGSGFFILATICVEKVLLLYGCKMLPLSLLILKWVSVIWSVLAVLLLECCKMLFLSLLIVKWVSTIWSV